MKNLVFLFICCCLHIQVNAQCENKSRSGIHVVQSKETIYKIAKMYNLSTAQLCDLNDMDMNKILFKCEELIVSGNLTRPDSYNSQGVPNSGNFGKQNSNRHTVQSGETAASIAQMYGYTEARFREFNSLGNLPLTPGSTVFSSDCTCGDRMMYDEPGTPGYKTNGSGSTTPTSFNEDPKLANQQTETGDLYAHSGYMKPVEKDMIKEINLMRSDPSGYVQYINEYVTYQKENDGWPIDQSVVDELNNDLRNSPVLSQLAHSECMYRAAKSHGAESRQVGDTNHRGLNGDMPWDRILKACSAMTDGTENIVGGPSTVRESVIILLIDEGIPGRGHRKALMNPQWTHVACYKIGMVGDMPNSWIQKFGYEPNASDGAGSNTGSATDESKANNKKPALDTNTDFMQSVEKDMITEINLMRSDPAGYVRYINEYVTYQKENDGWPIDQSVVDELNNDLRNSPVLSQLAPSECMYRAAEKHGAESRQVGDTNHRGLNGDMPWDRILKACSAMTDGTENIVGGPSTVRESVIILLIDEGIPGRGHRKALMNPQWTHVACYKIGMVGDMPNSWIQKFGY